MAEDSKQPSAESELAQIASRLEGAVVDTLLDKLRTVDLKVEEFEEFFRGLLPQSDTVIAIVGSSYLDDRLRQLFTQAVNSEISGGTKKLLGAFGPLGTFDARIQVGGAMYWLAKDTYLSLHLIRKIRNEFAHKPFARTFDEDRISELVASMTSTKEGILLNDLPERLRHHLPLTNRQRFFVRTVLAGSAMITEMCSAPYATRMGLDPVAALRVEWDRAPKAFNELSCSTVKLVYECISGKCGSYSG